MARILWAEKLRKGTCVSEFGLKGRELSKNRGKGTRIRVPGAREGRRL